MQKVIPIFLAFNAAFSLPISPQVLMGDAAVRSEGNWMEIQSGPFSHIKWDQFDIEMNETVRFMQPDANAIAINEILSAAPSILLGKLEAPGKIVLINPNGLLIGKSAVIDTGSLVASTLDLIESTANQMRFAGTTKNFLIQDGKIDSGQVLLIGSRIESRGEITADGLYFSCGNEIAIEFGDAPAITFTNSFQSGGIELGGKLTSNRIFLEAPAATISIDGQLIGDEVRVLGASNHLYPGTLIDVSSLKGGGTILIGRNTKVENPPIANSSQTWVLKDAALLANALDSGNGGKVVLWGDEMTYFGGRIEAKGGPNGGHGGFVEISSKAGLFPTGKVDTTALLGKTGTLLFDPCAVTISNDPTTFGVTPTSAIPLCPLITPQNYQFLNLSSANINISDLVGYIGCNNVTIDASASGGAASGSIILTAAADTPAGGPLTWNSLGAGPDPTKLTLIADGFIDIRNVITSSTPSASAFTPVIEVSAPVVRIGDPGLALGNAASLNSVSGRIIVNAANSLSIYSCAGGPDAGIQAGTAGTGSIQIGCGSLLLQSNSANTIVEAPTDITILATGNIDLIGGTVDAGFNKTAFIRTPGGTLNISGGGNINMIAGAGFADSSTQIGGPGADVICRIAGDYNLFGGANTMNSAIAGVAFNLAGSIELEGSNYFLVGGTAGAGGGFNFPYIGALIGGIGPVSVTATGSTGISLTAQAGHSAFIATTFDLGFPTGGDITINTTGLFLNGSSVSAPQFSGAFVSANGNISINASGDIELLGGSSTPGSIAAISAQQTGNSIGIHANNIEITSGSTTGSHALIGSSFGPVTIAIQNDCLIFGGSGSDTLSVIGAAISGGTGNLSISAANFNVLGGSGSSAVAGLAVGQDFFTGMPSGTGNLFLNATSSQGISLTGGSGAGSDAFISAAGTTASNGIFITDMGSVNLSSTNVSRAIITTFGGQINIDAANNLIMSSTGSMESTIRINPGPGTSDITIRLGNSAFINSTIENLGSGNILIAVDENFPSPFFGNNIFHLGASASLLTTAGAIRIFTSQQQLNEIFGTLNTLTFTPGSLFVDTNQEIWCVYFPSNQAGNPFTIFYKTCEQLLASQAAIIGSEILTDLHPFNEFPGWWKRFTIGYGDSSPPTPYFITVRQLGSFWSPKSYTAYLHDGGNL